MVIGPLPQADGFRQHIRECFHKHSSECRTLRVAKNDTIYISGQDDSTVYFIHVGKVKLLLPSPEYREYLLAIRSAGELFGELCLAGQTVRLETAVAMEDCCLKLVSGRTFLGSMRCDCLMEELVQYLTVRLAEEQEVIATLAMLKSEKRLAWTLLQLGRVLGQSDAHGTQFTQRISQEDLAVMVGTTRTRIGVFLKRFRKLGLIGLSPERWLVIDNDRLKFFLDHRYTDESDARSRLRQPKTGLRPGAPTAG